MWAYYKKGMAKPEKVTGVEIVQKLRTGEIDGETFVIPPTEQNWRKLKDAEKYLPFKQTTKGKVTNDTTLWKVLIDPSSPEEMTTAEMIQAAKEGRIKNDTKVWKKGFASPLQYDDAKVQDELKDLASKHTVWYAYIDPKKPTKMTAQEIAIAVSKRQIQGNTYIWRAGYDKPLKYSHQDVQDELKELVRDELPTLGDTDLIGKKVKFTINGKVYGPENAEDLPKNKYITDDSWVWVIGDPAKKWIKYNDFKERLPSVGQAHQTTDRSLWGKIKKGLNWATNHDLTGREVNDDNYVKKANATLAGKP